MPKNTEEWLQPGETLMMRIGANHTEGSTARGGWIWLTDRRLLFAPHGLDASLGASRVEIPLAQIANVGKEPGGCGPGAWFSGGLRARLRVETADGTRHLFVVNGLDTVIARIEQQLKG